MTNTAEKVHHIVNGFNTVRIIDLATKMTQDEDFGKFRFRANNNWINGSRNCSQIINFYAGKKSIRNEIFH